MNKLALSDAELRVMGAVWNEEDVTTASHVAEVLKQSAGLSPAATYTLLGRCVKKGALERIEPGYRCRALVSREEVQNNEVDDLIDKMFDGSSDKLFAALVGRKKISKEEIRRLRDIAGDV